MPNDWSQQEAEAAVTDYFDMLDKWLRGEELNKAEHNRKLQQLLVNRSRGSIEWKHQNISAVLIELGYPYLEGYKPRFNYQDLLRSIVANRLNQEVHLHQTALDAVSEPMLMSPPISNVLSIIVPPPKRDDEPRELRETPTERRNALRRNYLEIEARNASLGLAGEKLVLRYEHERLWRAGKHHLADRVEHIAQTKGDHFGFDILSFEENGQERLIEVKTTRFGPLTPFFASRNEVNLSESRYNEYRLYRLFNFRAEPRLFVLNGSLDQTCLLEPNLFSAMPK